MLKNKLKKGISSKKDSKKESSKKKVAYHYCEKCEHFKNECPLLQKKEENKKSKKKGLLSTSKDLESASTISEEKEKEEHAPHLCFMANNEDKVEFSDLSNEDLLNIIDDLLINSKNMLFKYTIIKKENELLHVENAFLKFEIEALKSCFNQSSSCDLKSKNDMLHQNVKT